ncbi:MAG: Crp/Fnr family transcriptional regulator [Paludibacteraceae bacterium]|nr:Crp/Fnr family transcriptional regulator [Paludibacteraceae bacterium]
MHIYSFGTIFRGISAEDKKLIAASETVKSFMRGEVIYNVGDRPSHLLCVIEGTVKICVTGLDRCQIVRFVCPGEFFGLRPLLARERYVLSAYAVSDVKILCMPTPLFLKFLTTHPSVSIAVASEIATCLGTIDKRLVSLTQKHTRGRLAEALLDISSRFGRDFNSGAICCLLTREEIACYANMTTANAIRTLSDFVAEGIISLKGRQISILDEKGLHRICNLG